MARRSRKESGTYPAAPSPSVDNAFDELDPKSQATVRSWFARGDRVAVFRNVVLDSADVGRCVYVPYAPDATVPVHAPDGAHGLGWKFRLQGLATSEAEVRTLCSR